MNMEPTFSFTCSWKKKKYNFLGNSPQITFPVSHPHIPLQSWPKFLKPGPGDVVMALWVGRKATRNTIVRGDGSETHLSAGKQVITESLLCPFSVLSH